MRRWKLITVIFAVMLVFMTGCGKKEENTEDQPDDNVLVEAQLDVIIDKKNATDSGEDLAEQSEAASIDEPVKFECKDEIKNASPDSGLIQIDDMLFQYGAKFSEISDQIQKSECTYESEEYNVSSVVPAGKRIAIRFFKNGEQHFLIRMENQETETIELKDCVVYGIYASEGLMRNAYYAGFNNDEMTYSTVKELMKDYELEKEIFGTDKNGNKELGVMYTVPYQEDEIHIYFIYDGVTNELKKFEVTSWVLVDSAWPW